MNELIDGVFLGDKADANDDRALDRHGIERVVTLMQSRQAATTDFHPLADGANQQAVFDAAVETVRDAIVAAPERPVLVHCAMGQSRSVVVLTTAMAAEQDEWYHEAYARIRRTGREVFPQPDLISAAKTYLDEPEY